MTEAQKLEFEIMQKAQQLAELRNQEADANSDVPNYTFLTLDGKTTLAELFANQDRLLLIHNMGQGCRYCTLWADGINGILKHLENAMSVVLVSKDAPDVQRRFAAERGWNIRIASHSGGAYMKEQCAFGDDVNMPGAVVYERKDNKIVRRGGTIFGPGDLYSPMWHFLALAGISSADWTPQYRYWQAPDQLDDGGDNVVNESA